MNKNDYISKIKEEITRLKIENLQQKNEMEELSLNHERQIDALIKDFITIIDAYEKAEAKVQDLGPIEDDTAQRAIKRMSQPKKVAFSVLSKYNVSQIDIVGKRLNENICSVVETEPDNEKENDIVLSIEKNGYVRGERLIRRAEVIVVRN